MKTFYFYFLALLTFASCSRVDDNEITMKNGVDVYVAGTENNEACYWKNGVKTTLTGGVGYRAQKVYIENNDIYVFATHQNPATYEVNYYYWKNNVKYSISQITNTPLNTPTNRYFDLSDFFVINGDVYIAGLTKYLATSSQNQYCYWKNGVKTIVFSQSYYETSAKLFIFGNDAYVPLTNFNGELGYYKNGVFNFVSNQASFYDIHEILGSPKILVKDYTNQTLYYKDLNTGIVTSTPSFIPYDYPTFKSIYDGNDHYYYGFHSQYYYNNNVQQNLYPTGSGFIFLNDFTVKNGNIYKITHSDNNIDGVNYKVYANDVIIQQTSNAVSTNNGLYTEYTQLTIVL